MWTWCLNRLGCVPFAMTWQVQVDDVHVQVRIDDEQVQVGGMAYK